MKTKIIFWTALTLLAGFYFYASVSFIRVSAATYDETVHLSSGYSYLETGKYLMNIMDHPPLAEMLAALPLRFMNLNSFTTHKYFSALMPYHYGNLFLYENNKDPEKILNSSRYFLLFLWGSLFFILFYFFGRALGGDISAFFAAAVFCVNPLFISNVPLVTTDIAPSFFYALSSFAGFLLSSEKPPMNDYSLASLAGIAGGLAMASKYSMFVLPPFFSALLIFNNFFTGKFKTKKLVKILFVYLFVSLFILVLVYRGDLSLYSDALLETFRRLNKGRASFVFGVYSLNGVWWYFPAAFLLKNSFFFVCLFFIGLIGMIRGWRRYLWVLLPFFFYFAASVNSKVQIGVRHILPVMPFAVLIVASGVKFLFEKYSKQAFYFVIPFFMVSFFFTARTGPFYLSYFTQAVGGASEGYKYMTDSNIDWGQDIKSLSSYLKGQGNPPVIFSYFGVANPNYYNINCVPLGIITNTTLNIKRTDLCSFQKLLIAISVTNLQGTYYVNNQTFAWLKTREPVYKAGYSIFLYDLTGDTEGAGELKKVFEKSGMSGEAACLERKFIVPFSTKK